MSILQLFVFTKTQSSFILLYIMTVKLVSRHDAFTFLLRITELERNCCHKVSNAKYEGILLFLPFQLRMNIFSDKIL